MRTSPVLLFVLCVSSLLLWASPVPAQTSAFAIALRARRTYYQTQVTPVIAQQRRRLAQVLSRRDNDLLNSVQRQLYALTQLGVRLTTPLPNGTRRVVSASEQQRREQLPQQTKQALARLAPLLDKHRVLLADIAQHLKQHRAAWLAAIAHLPPLPDHGPATDKHIIDNQLSPTSLLLSAAPIVQTK